MSYAENARGRELSTPDIQRLSVSIAWGQVCSRKLRHFERDTLELEGRCGTGDILGIFDVFEDDIRRALRKRL